MCDKCDFLTVPQIQISSCWALSILWLRVIPSLLVANGGQKIWSLMFPSIAMDISSKMTPEGSWISLRCRSQTKASTGVNTQEMCHPRVGWPSNVSMIKTSWSKSATVTSKKWCRIRHLPRSNDGWKMSNFAIHVSYSLIMSTSVHSYDECFVFNSLWPVNYRKHLIILTFTAVSRPETSSVILPVIIGLVCGMSILLLLWCCCRKSKCETFNL